VTLRWDGTDDPKLPGCGSTPIAVEIHETPTAIRIGLIGPIPPDPLDPAENSPPLHGRPTPGYHAEIEQGATHPDPIRPTAAPPR
jgi:hypothetical protein